MGTAARCANEPQRINIDRVTAVFSDGTFNDFNASQPISDTNVPIIAPDWYPAIFNLIQVIIAAIRIDLGNPSPNNFLLHPSALNETIASALPPNATDSLLYQANIHPEIYGIQDMLPLTVTGPSVMQVVFPCRFQRWKPTGSLVISVLVVTLSMFSSGWAVFMVIARSWVKRGNPKGEASI